MLAGKVAIVTGGSRGIGRATAERLARDGAQVVVNCVRAEAEAEAVVAAIVAGGGEAIAVRADVFDLAEIPTLFEAAEKRFGRPGIIVANAGVYAQIPIANTTEEIYDKMFGMTKGTFFLLQTAAEKIADGGRIVTISSGATQGWANNGPAYAGAKAAIEVFTRALSKVLGPRGVTVNTVLPGVTETEMVPDNPAFRERAAGLSSFGRLGKPEDIADIVAFLASDDGRWITGQRIGAHGGMN
jgi:3-oxoacyl-[acyl-carrier protein] reductase